MKRIVSFAAVAGLLVTAACGGGNGVAPTPSVPKTNAKSTVTFQFSIPMHQSASSQTSARKPEYLSAGSNGLDFFEDGNALAGNYTPAMNPGLPVGTVIKTSPNGDILTYQGGSFNATTGIYTVALQLVTSPGPHTFGAAVRGAAPAIILSENQITQTLAPNTTTSIQIGLRGVVAHAAIECATVAQNLAGNNCNNYANMEPGNVNGTYDFTAVAEDYEGFPISQSSLDTSLTFDNGKIVPTIVAGGTGSAHIVSNGPWNAPGNALQGAPAGSSWETHAGLTATYGNAFKVVCDSAGTVNVGVQLVGTAPFASTNQLSGESYVTNTDWPGIASDGSLTPGYPGNQTGPSANGNGIPSIAQVMCGSSTSGFTLF